MARKIIEIEQANTELDISVAFAVDTVWMTTGRNWAKAFESFSTFDCHNPISLAKIAVCQLQHPKVSLKLAHKGGTTQPLDIKLPGSLGR